ncbi:ADP-ribosylation [Hygrophoropsis aurantiaca]|uniref:ADP-ribosylation n=1 Tax=Hygrophoropsis aurantiaca TaxID=72124 RepID=A0ACB8AKI9_9AGAM|nr:ADP-ribosylation [Hygrophoropsis aurantiaca]
MATAVPPMHAALSVLGTMAGQYLAAQSAQAQQAPAKQPGNVASLFTAPPAAPTTANLCDACHAKPKYNDGVKTHNYCSKRCAAMLQKASGSGKSNVKRSPSKAARAMCDYCHKQPKYFDGTTTHSFCGKSCAQKAKAQGGATPNPVSVKNGCLMCGKAVKSHGHFCSQVCTTKAEKAAPMVLEVPPAHKTFTSVADQFKSSWRHQTACPTVRRVYKVVGLPSSVAKYEAYRSAVEARGNFVASGRSAGNENRRWHGTTRECTLGDNGNCTMCSSTTCSLCSILRTSYNLNLFGKKTGWGRFGAGIYTSSTSSKSNDYSNNTKSSNLKAILLNKVVVGKGYKMTQDSTKLTAAPAGYDSVLAEVANGGSLNYDELICYTNDAIRPSYLVMYDA